MKIGELSHLLAGLSQGLLEISKKTADSLHTLHEGLRPFEDQTIEQFLVFLGKCEEYQRTGQVGGTGRKWASPRKDEPAVSVAQAAAEMRGLLEEINRGTLTLERIDSWLAKVKQQLKKPQLDELLSNVGIAGGAKTKDQGIAKIRQVLASQLEMFIKSKTGEFAGTPRNSASVPADGGQSVG